VARHFALFARSPDLGVGLEDGDFVSIFQTDLTAKQLPLVHRGHYRYYTIEMSEAEAKKTKQQLEEAGKKATGIPQAGLASKFAKATEDKVVARLQAGRQPFKLKAGLVDPQARLRVASQSDHIIVSDKKYKWADIAETH
jgi:hypothetical protein